MLIVTFNLEKNDKHMAYIRFVEIKYSHPLWDELSENKIFFKNLQ